MSHAQAHPPALSRSQPVDQSPQKQRNNSKIPENTIVDSMSTSGPPSKMVQLLDLPTELILHISHFLPPSSTASLSLCNKKLSTTLSHPAWIKLRNHKLERIHFLTLLSRDLPPSYACNGCGSLHPSRTIPFPGHMLASSQPTSCIPDSTLAGYHSDNLLPISNYFSSYSLLFAHVQLALKRHVYGAAHGIALRDLAYSDILLIGTNVYFFTVEARIDEASSELLLRSQEWIVSRQSPRSHFTSKSIRHGVCQHLMTYDYELGFEDRLTEIVRCRVNHARPDEKISRDQNHDREEDAFDRERHCACLRLRQCYICPMEFRLDIIDLQDLGETLCVTKWLNLGSGESAEDPFWRGHERGPEDYTLHNLPLGQIRSRFECREGSGATVEEMTAVSREILRDELCVYGGEGEEMIVMRDGSLGWYEVGGESRTILGYGIGYNFKNMGWRGMQFSWELLVVFLLAEILLLKLWLYFAGWEMWV